MKYYSLQEHGDLLNDFYRRFSPRIFHTLAYKIFIEEAFGSDYNLLVGVERGQIQILLPLVGVKSSLFGNKLISSAYIEYGSFLGDGRKFEELLESLGKKYGSDFDFLEIRGGCESQDLVLSAHMLKRNLYKRFVLELKDIDGTWMGVQKSKRKAVKKALKSVKVRPVPLDDLDPFYDLYLENMKRFGSPPYSKKYFESFYEHLVPKKMGRIMGSYFQGKLISALVGFTYGKRVHILIAVSDPQYQEFRPNDAMHWEFIKWAISKGYKYFDFGRVREKSGQFEYKRKWGAELFDLPSYFKLWRVDEVPFTDPTSKKYKLLGALWKKLPVGLTEKIGMRLRKQLGI